MNDIFQKITQLKNQLKDQVIILAHHYQKDEIVKFADHVGDSLELAKIARSVNKKYIIFCGVNFMAETADMLTNANQTIILPVLEAGCSMADMASIKQVEYGWKRIKSASDKKIIPVTYINSNADLKAFVGRHDGNICTSSNAEKIINWAFQNGEQLLFFPDQHLGRNTCYKMGISLDDMLLYDPMLPDGGVSAEQIAKAKVILWQGYCCVHQNFHPDRMKEIKRFSPETTIIVHPECYFDAVQTADLSGSTSYIVETVKNAPQGKKFAIGTESNLVNRLKKEYPNKFITTITKDDHFCRSMNLITAKHLLHSLEMIQNGTPEGIVHVDESIKKDALLALNRMLAM